METTFPLGLLELAESDSLTWGHWLQRPWNAGCSLQNVTLSSHPLPPTPPSLHTHSSLGGTHVPSGSKLERKRSKSSVHGVSPRFISFSPVNKPGSHLFIHSFNGYASPTNCIPGGMVHDAIVLLRIRKLSLRKVKGPTLGDILGK